MEQVEKFNKIIDEAYENYTQNTSKSHVAGSDSDPMKLSMDWKGKNDYSSGYPILERLSKEDFIRKIKTDDEFSQKWGLTIEERVLSLEERMELWYQKNQNDTGKRGMWEIDYTEKYEGHKKLNLYGIPRKQITLTHNNETIESYE